MTTTQPSVAPSRPGAARETTYPLPGWTLIVTGSLWLLFSIVVFRFNIHTVTAVGIAVAIVCIAAGVNEFTAIGTSETGAWKVVRAILGGLFMLVGVIALAYPHRTFVEVAAIFSFFLVIKGTFDIVLAFVSRSESGLWWLGLIAGVAQVLLAFWAAGAFGREAVLLVVWVGAAALIRGITEICLAFAVREGRAGA
jgi:uncharacterized membrane protein HdeD (DUF308 family)